jgi:outer membrane protein assembly factor BamB
MLWDLELGEGHAAPVAAHGSVYILDYDEVLRADTLRRISLADGKEIWRRFYRVPLKRNHGLSRTAPAVWDRYVVTLGPMCHVMGVDALSGDLLWSLDLVEVYSSEVPLWYAGQNPLIIDGVVYLAPGGEAFMIALDAATGDLLWETPNPESWPMSHASIIPAEIEGTDMLLYAATEGVLGVSFDGDILWTYDRWTSPVTVPSAVPLSDGRIFFSAGYGTGSLMLRVFRSGTGWETEELFSYASGDGLSTEQQSALFIEEMLIGINPKDAKSLRNRLVAMSPEGEVLWSALAEERPDLGPYLYADGRLYILKDDGTLMMGEPGREGFTLTGRAKVLSGPDAWAPMALAGGRLLLRDTGRMVCLDLK